MIPHLKEQGRCIALDHIGMGNSDKPNIPYGFKNTYLPHPNSSIHMLLFNCKGKTKTSNNYYGMGSSRFIMRSHTQTDKPSDGVKNVIPFFKGIINKRAYQWPCLTQYISCLLQIFVER